MLLGVRMRRSRRKYGDRAPPRPKRATMRLDVDPSRAARDHRDAPRREVSSQSSRLDSSIRRRAPRADDRHRRLRLGVERALHEHHRRRVVRRSQQRRKRRIPLEPRPQALGTQHLKLTRHLPADGIRPRTRTQPRRHLGRGAERLTDRLRRRMQRPLGAAKPLHKLPQPRLADALDMQPSQRSGQLLGDRIGLSVLSMGFRIDHAADSTPRRRLPLHPCFSFHEENRDAQSTRAGVDPTVIGEP